MKDTRILMRDSDESKGNNKSDSITEIKILWIDIGHLNQTQQVLICSIGVFVFYLMYGYLQVSNKNGSIMIVMAVPCPILMLFIRRNKRMCLLLDTNKYSLLIFEFRFLFLPPPSPLRLILIYKIIIRKKCQSFYPAPCKFW